ncbi:MAG: OmpA family protein [Saprospiraceae bacterium]
MQRYFIFFLFLFLIGSSSCVSNKKFVELLTEKDTSDSTISYLNYQLELANVREKNQQSQFDNNYRQIQAELKILRQEMRSSNAELQQLIEGKNAELTDLQRVVEENYYAAKPYGIVANYDSTQTRTWLKETIYFNSGQTQPSEKDLEKLDYLIAVLDSHLELELQIIGHTDAVPPRVGDNLDVSYRRAKQMRSYFVKKGIAEQRLAIVAQGALKPLEKGSVLASDRNRRVEFVLLTRNVKP